MARSPAATNASIEPMETEIAITTLYLVEGALTRPRALASGWLETQGMRVIQ